MPYRSIQRQRKEKQKYNGKSSLREAMELLTEYVDNPVHDVEVSVTPLECTPDYRTFHDYISFRPQQEGFEVKIIVRGRRW